MTLSWCDNLFILVNGAKIQYEDTSIDFRKSSSSATMAVIKGET